jgi:hypothetical protein
LSGPITARTKGGQSRLRAISMWHKCCAACPPSGSRQATAHRSVRFGGVFVSAFCPLYGSMFDRALRFAGADDSHSVRDWRT